MSVIKEYALTSYTFPIAKNEDSSEETIVNSEETIVNSELMQQIKSNQTKLNQTKLLDSQTAEADENESEINFYLENISEKISALDDDTFLEYKQRLIDITDQAKKVGSFTINKIKVSLAEFLKVYQFIFSNPQQIQNMFYTIDSNPNIKNKFAYTISTIYNTVKNF